MQMETEAQLVERAATVGARDRPPRGGPRSRRHVRRRRACRPSATPVSSPSPCPTELGGLGATIREVAAVQRELAHHCGSTALATSMHQHVVSFTAWRYRRDLPGAEATLRRVADDGIVLVSTGGADLTHPKGEATKVEGGYRVSGRKVLRQPVGGRGTSCRRCSPSTTPRKGAAS